MEIAVELRLAAIDAARSVEDTELLAAKLPESRGIAFTLDQMRDRAAALGRAHEIFKSMAMGELVVAKAQPKPTLKIVSGGQQ